MNYGLVTFAECDMVLLPLSTYHSDPKSSFFSRSHLSGFDPDIDLLEFGSSLSTAVLHSCPLGCCLCFLSITLMSFIRHSADTPLTDYCRSLKGLWVFPNQVPFTLHPSLSFLLGPLVFLDTCYVTFFLWGERHK